MFIQSDVRIGLGFVRSFRSLLATVAKQTTELWQRFATLCTVLLILGICPACAHLAKSDRWQCEPIADRTLVRRSKEVIAKGDERGIPAAKRFLPLQGNSYGYLEPTLSSPFHARFHQLTSRGLTVKAAMFLCAPLLPKKGRKLWILFYARYSTEEQDASSIPDQYAYCNRHLKSANIKIYEVEELSDAEISGEHISRPGIDLVREGIAKRKWDLIICEDSSRLSRNVAPALQLVGAAVDNGIRVICINDDVDTADKEHWEERLTEALSHHAQSNRFTSRRIKRKLEALWEMGAAVVPRKPGYERRASIPARMGERAKGPFFDEVDTEWVPVIHEAYERIARGQSPWIVGDWLTSIRFPKSANAKSEEWHEYNVIALIRRTDYRGYETYRNTVSEKQHGTGRRPQRRNEDPETILSRQLERLRIVPDSLWHRANSVLDERDSFHGDRKRGADNPLTGVPRDSRGPLSKTFLCTICGGKMWQEGRNDGGYRCARSLDRKEPCWNKASALRDLTHERIGQAVAEQLIASKEHLDVLVDYAESVVQRETSTERRLNDARTKVQRLSATCKKVADAIERVESESACDTLVQRLVSREAELVMAKAEVEDLEAALDESHRNLVTRDQLEAAIDEVAAKLLKMDRETGELLHRLVGRMEAVPFQQFQSDKVVLRARFTLRFADLLPAQLGRLMKGEVAPTESIELIEKTVLVDLFDPSSGPRCGLQAFALKQQGLSLVKIGRQLGISKRSAHIATQYGKAMTEADISDPFIVLTERPAAASRWR